jgi:16S rRNA G966 N2-methylase RsmD
MNSLFCGDNLRVLRDSIGSVGSDSVDLIYLDPPFNSQATSVPPALGGKAG